MEFNKYIKELLLQKDNVIIPNFGAFEKIMVSASIDEKTGEMTPPHTSVVFNASLKTDSGVLINYIAEKEKIDTEKVVEEITNLVNLWNNDIDSGKNVTISGIGVINKLSSGTIEFQSNIKPEDFPDSYGLPIISVKEKTAIQSIDNKSDRKKPIKKVPEKKNKPVKKQEKSKAPTNKPPKVKESTDGKKSNKVLIVSLAIILPIVTIVAVGFIFSDFWAKKFEGTFVAEIFSKEEVKDTSNKIVNIQDITAKDSSDMQTEAILKNYTIISSDNDKKLEPKLSTLSKVKKVHIVAGSYKVKQYAQKHRNKLNRKGFKSKVLKLNKGYYRVAISSFDDIESAAKDFDRIKSIDESLNLWILVDE